MRAPGAMGMVGASYGAPGAAGREITEARFAQNSPYDASVRRETLAVG